MDSKASEVISRLKLIASLKKGEKINTRTISVQPNTLFTSFYRKFYIQDNRTNMISFIQETINCSYELLDKFKKSKDKSEIFLYTQILEDLEQSLNGIERLKETYALDTKVVCDLQTIVQVTTAKLQNFQPQE